MTATVIPALPDGSLHAPGDPAYEDACTLFNAMIERRPRLVARCAAPADVAAALRLARAERLPVAVRGGGHSVTGQSLVHDRLVLDVRPMDAVDVDPVRRVARVGGGATWGAVDAPHSATALRRRAAACRAPESPGSRSVAAPAGSSAASAWPATTCSRSSS